MGTICSKCEDLGSQRSPGVKYVLDKLPTGYALFGKYRQNDPKHIDRYLCGNPKYKYRSIEEFYEHFKNLMDHGNVDSCGCRACSGKKRNRQSGVDGASAAKRAKRAVGSTLSEVIDGTEGPLPQLREHRKALEKSRPRVDEEGTPDVVSMLIERLKTDPDHAAFDESLTQLDSFDWLINRSLLKQFFKEAKSKPRHLPRIGELVLFHRSLALAEFIAINPKSERYERFDATTGMFTRDNNWEAGVITQTPAGDLSLSDVAASSEQQDVNTNYAGFRIEPMPEIGAAEKPWSKRSVYVALHQTRPFYMYKDLLGDTAPDAYHVTVKHAMTALSSFSMVSGYFFRARWPVATVFYRAMYLGAELLMVGDVVRLASDGDEIEDVMQITAIKSKFARLDGERPVVLAGEDAPPAVHETCIHVSGVAYTNNVKKAWSNSPAEINLGIGEYGRWYHLHDPAKRWEQPFSRLIGRCYEGTAVLRMLHGPDTRATTDDTALSLGFEAIREGRLTTSDPRIAEGKTWFWADSRVEQLDLHQVNEHMVAEGADGELDRDPAAWMRAIKIRARGAPLKSVKPSDVTNSEGGKLDAIAPAQVIDVDAMENEAGEAVDDQAVGDVRASKRALDPTEFAEMLGGLGSESED